MTTDIHPTDERLDSILADYFQQLDSGEAVSPTSLLAANPELADQLREFFDAATFVENLAGPTQSEQTQMLGVHDTARNSLVGETIVSHSSPHAPREARISRSEMATHFGRYEIQRLLGQGAMGAVYLAYDPSLQRQVALKIPKFNADESPDMSERFLREARSAATLRHANICPVYDVGRVDGVHYITMAYIEGRTLADEIRAGRTFAPREIATIARKLALAMSKAHSAGVVHRDLKPGNIMLDPDGEPILMDFGLAYREETDELRLTKSGMIVGSPAYMSPEQIDGDPTKIGPASDIYSLGVVLYEMITGKLPFQGTMMSVIGQIAHKEPTPVGQWRPELADSPLERLCRKLLAKRPEERPQSMQDVAAALDYVLSGLPASGSAVGNAAGAVGNALRGVPKDGEKERQREREMNTSASLTPSLRPSVSPSLLPAKQPDLRLPNPEPRPISYPASLAQERTERAKMFLATTLILAALLGLFGALAGIVYVATNQGTLEITSNSNDIQIEVANKDGTVKVIDLVSGTEVHRLPLGDYTIKVKGDRTDVFLDTNGFKMTRGGKVLVEAQLTPRLPGPVTLPPPVAVDRPANPPPTRLPGPQPIARLTDHANSVRAIAFDPDGQHFVTAGFDNTIRRRRLADGQQVSLIDTGRHSAYRAAFDSRGRLVTTGLDATVRLWDLAAGHELVQNTAHAKPVAALAIEPGGKTSLTGSWDGALRRWDLEQTDDSQSLADSAGTVWDIDVAASGKQAAVADFRGPVTLWDLEAKEPPVELGKHEGGALAVAYVGGGEKLLSAGRDGALKLWDVAERKLLREQSFAGVWIESLGVSPDGKYALVGLSAPDKAPTVDPAAGQCVLWDLQAWQDAARLHTGLPCIYAAEFSPDGKLIVTGGGQHGHAGGGAVSLWRLEDVLKFGAPSLRPFEEAGRLAGHSDVIDSLAWSRDGRHLFSGGGEKRLLQWDVTAGQVLRKIPTGDFVTGVVPHSDGKHVFTSSYRGPITLWELESGQPVRKLEGHTNQVFALALTPQGDRLLSGGRDGLTRLWDTATGETIRSFDTGYCDAVALSADGKVAAHDTATGIDVWDVATGDFMISIGRGGSAMAALAFTPDGKHLIGGNHEGLIRAWAIDTGKETLQVPTHNTMVRSLVVTPDGRHFISGNNDKTLRMFEWPSGREVARLDSATFCTRVLALSPDGRTLASGGGMIVEQDAAGKWIPRKDGDYAIRLWRLPTLPEALPPQVKIAPAATGAEPPFKHVAALRGHGGPIFAVAASTDGLIGLSASDDYFVRLWDLPGRKQLREFKADGAMRCVAISQGGTRAAWSGGQKDIIVWDLKENKELKTLTGHSHWVYSLQFTKDAKRLLSISRDKTVQLWDLATGESTLTLETINRQDIVACLSPDETKILASSDNGYTLSLWNVADGQLLTRLNGHGPEGVYAAAFSPDGAQIATADGKGAIHLRDATTGEPRVTWLGHQGRVTGLAFTPDSKHLVSGGFDKALCLRDAQTGALVARSVADTQITNHIAVLPSGLQVLTAGGWFMSERDEFQQPGDFDVHVWDLPEIK